LTGIGGGQFFTNFHQKASKKSEKISKNDHKLTSKYDQKKVILNGKSEKRVKK